MHVSNLFFVASVYVQLDLMRVKTRKQGAWEQGYDITSLSTCFHL